MISEGKQAQGDELKGFSDNEDQEMSSQHVWCQPAVGRGCWPKAGLPPGRGPSTQISATVGGLSGVVLGVIFNMNTDFMTFKD